MDCSIRNMDIAVRDPLNPPDPSLIVGWYLGISLNDKQKYICVNKYDDIYQIGVKSVDAGKNQQEKEIKQNRLFKSIVQELRSENPLQSVHEIILDEKASSKNDLSFDMENNLLPASSDVFTKYLSNIHSKDKMVEKRDVILAIFYDRLKENKYKTDGKAIFDEKVYRHDFAQALDGYRLSIFC